MSRHWQLAATTATPLTTIAELRSLLLHSRGVMPDASAAFFEPDYERDIGDPFTFYGMEEAVDRIFMAIEKQQHIIIHGDYDADGVTSTTILVATLRSLGAHVTPFLPHREDHGYGLNQAVLKSLADEMDLLITVDCGITATEEIAWLATQRIDTIVVDHHMPPAELPPARAIIHPAHPEQPYSCPVLCGAGTAWKLASALLRDARSSHSHSRDHEKWLLDLAVIGTIADVVPLKGENRALTIFGLQILSRTRRPGLRRLLGTQQLLGTSLTSTDISFKVIPQINAAGRIDHAQPALDLLLAETDARAERALAVIVALNQQRQTITRRVVREAEAQVVTDDPVVFVHNHSWPAGVVGLAASRLAKKFSRPAFVLGGNGEHAVGSARTPAGANVVDLLRSGQELLLKFGGHERAAGFSVEPQHIAELQAQLNAHMSQAQIAPERSVTAADAVLDPLLVNRETAQLLNSFEPFGQGNERPCFIIEKLPLAEWRPVGKQGDHAKCTFRIGEDPLDGIGFGLAGQLGGIASGDIVDVVGELTEDEWRGRRRLQLTVQELVPTGTIPIHASGNTTH